MTGADGPWLGIDAGATHTEAVVLSDSLVIWRGSAGPVNHLAGEAGRRRMTQAFGSLVADLTPDLRRVIVAVAVGLSGLGIPGKGEDVRDIFAGLLPNRPLYLTDDLVAALWGATGGGDGMILLCGTGSAAVARCGDRLVRVGARGSLFSDDGSAFAVGQAAVRAALHAVDGTGPETTLAAALTAATGMDRVTQIPPRAFAEAWGSAEVAQLARVVGRAAAEGDEVAVAILEAAGADLGRLGAAALSAAGRNLTVTRVGRGWQVSPLLWSTAMRHMRTLTGGEIETSPPREDAAAGVVRWALAGGPTAV